MLWRRLLFAAGLGIGCSSPAPEQPDAGVDGGTDELDLSRASWELTGAGVTPGYAGGAALGFTPSGPIVAWSELDTEVVGGERPLLTAAASADFAPERLTPEADVSFASANLATAGESLHLAFAEVRGSGTNIFYARRDGADWSEPENLSGPVAAAERRDSEPVVVAAGEDIAVFYLSAPSDDTTSPGVHLLRFSGAQRPTAAEILIDAAQADCDDIDAAADSGGALHLVATCSINGGPAEVLYLNNRGGDFFRQSAALGPGSAPRSPAMAIGPDDVVNLVWTAEADCGGVSCRDVFHSRNLGAPTSVTGSSEDGGGFPRVAVLPGGAVIVAFHRTDSRDLHWSYAEVGQSFIRVQAATSGADTLDYLIGALELDGEGRPHMVFVRDYVGSDPIQADVFLGTLR